MMIGSLGSIDSNMNTRHNNIISVWLLFFKYLCLISASKKKKNINNQFFLKKRPREPRVKNIRVLIYFYILSISLVSFLKCFISIPSNNVFLFIVFSNNVPNRYPVSPP